MSGYFYMLILTSVCGSVCAMLASGGFEKYIKYIVALICTILILVPFRDFDLKEIGNTFSDISGESHTSEGLYPLATEITENRAEEYISQIVFSEFGITPLYTHIKIDWEQHEPIIESISIAVGSGDISRSEEIKKYLKDILGGEVEIVEG